MFLEENHGKGSLLKSSAARGWVQAGGYEARWWKKKQAIMAENNSMLFFSFPLNSVKHLVLLCGPSGGNL